MFNPIEKGLTDREFWDRMLKNSLVVKRMPAWMKGSAVNKRTQIPARITENRVNLKSRPSANRQP
jgi:hypothetical protein